MERPREAPRTLSDDDLSLLDELLAEHGVEAAPAASGIRARPRPSHVPLSFAQELLWRLDHASPGMTAYNMPIARRLRGVLDLPALERSLGTIVARHEALRTRFVGVEGEGTQVIDPPDDVPVSVVDLRERPAAERERVAAETLRERVRRPFDLARDHMLRVTVVRLADDEHLLLVESHHAVFDGWSAALFFRELATCYGAYRAGREPELAPIPLQYADYALWQREHLSGPHLESLLAYWREQLGDVGHPAPLPTDHPRAGVPSFAGGRCTITVPAATLAAVQRLGQSRDATLYMTLLAAYMTVLHRYSARETVLVGSGGAGRLHGEVENVIGYFNNTLVLRGDFAGDPTFAELLDRVRTSCLGAYDHQEVPLEKLVLELRQGQDRLSDAPLFDVVFTMQDTIGATWELEGLVVEPYSVPLGATKFDLTLFPSVTDDGLRLSLSYRSELFEPATAERMLRHVQRVLEVAVADASVRISRLPLLTKEETAQLTAWGAPMTIEDGARATIGALIRAQAERVPKRVAVSSGDRSITYDALARRAAQLARRLRALGVTDGGRVGLCLERSVEAIEAIAGILEAGGVYVPLVPELPAARLARQIADAGLTVVVTRLEHVAALDPSCITLCLDRDADAIAAEPATAPASSARPESLAYVLFTSGSTGTPKGVAVTHGNVVHYVRALSRVLADVDPARPGDGLAALDGWRFGHVSSLGADLGNTSLFAALLAGGTLHLLPERAATEPSAFAEYIAAHPLEVLKITPNHLRALAGGRAGAELATVLPARWLITGGEALAWELASELLAANRCRVLNHYGPTETTVGATTFEVTAESMVEHRRLGAQTVPIGRPLPNTRVAVVDAQGERVPVGVPGELCIGGPGVAEGYLGRPDLTAERFVARPELGRAYRTGDRVRWLATGVLEFLGRFDHQVKVRGYRVELGEVEQVIGEHPAVAQAVVVLRARGAGNREPGTGRTEAPGDSVLVAYVVPQTSGYAAAHVERPTVEAITGWARERLPSYMVPDAVAILDTLPLTANGKVDRAALPDPADGDGASSGTSYAAPRTPTEIAIAGIWAEVLKRERVGRTDHFLALGGHSLVAIRILGKLSKSFGVRLPLRTLFEAPTVEKLAAIVDAECASAPAASDAITPAARAQYRAGTQSSGPAGVTGGQG